MNRQTEWKNRLLTLPDPVFFNLMRNYLGTLETPFNKHRMIERLSLYLGKESNLEVIAASLDEMDRKILTIIFLFNGTPEAPIIDLLQNLWSSWEIRQRLTNLQERLLLFKGKHDLYYPIPQTEEYLKTNTITTRELFPDMPRKEDEDSFPWLNDSFLSAILSVFVHKPPVRKNDGTLTRKALNELNAIFPVFGGSPEKPVYLLKVFASQGLIHESSNKKWKPVPLEWRKLSSEEPKTRLTGLWSDFLVYPEELKLPWKRGDGEKIISGLVKSMPGDALFSPDIILRILGLLLTEKRPPMEDLGIIRKRLVLLGILIEEQDGLGICRKLDSDFGVSDPSSGLTLHPNHEITLMPGYSLNTVYPLTWYTRIEKCDQVSTYILDQESYFKGLNRGTELPPFKEVLKTLSETVVPQNIEFSLDSWTDQFKSVRLIEGIVLKVNETRIPLIEKNPLFRPYIREILAPGIYLMDPREKELWEGTLLNTGITALPPVERVSASSEEFKPIHRSVEEGARINLNSGNDNGGSDKAGKESLIGTEKEFTVNQSTICSEDKLIKQLKDISLPEGEKEELEERIRKKVILHPGQIKEGIVQKDIREAKGLDYNGKIRLIETSLSSGQEYLEISWFTPNDDLQTDKIIPRHLSKEETDIILSGPYLADPGGAPFRIRVRKISHLKRKKLSFFGL